MCHQAKNIEKFGVANVDCKQRHTFLKKNVNENNKSDSNNSDTNSDKDEQNSDKNEKVIYKKYFYIYI